MEGLTNEFNRSAGRLRRFLTNDPRLKGSAPAGRLLAILAWFEAAGEVAKIPCPCEDCREAAVLAQIQCTVAEVWIKGVAETLPPGQEEVDRASA